MEKKELNNIRSGIISDIYENNLTLINTLDEKDSLYNFVRIFLTGNGLAINITVNIASIILGYILANFVEEF